MSDRETHPETGSTDSAVRSGVKIETNSKGFSQVKVAVYEGTTEDEMQRVKDLAVLVYEKTVAELGKRAEFS